MKEMTEVKIFNFCFALYFFVSFGLFLTGFFTGNKILTILGGILMTLEQFHDVFVSRVVRREYLFGALVGILIAVLLKKDWYLGAFWYFAIFYFIGILDNLRMLLFSTKRAKETTKNRELLPKGQYSKTDEKCPINPFEMTKRMKDVPEIIAWSRNKHLTIDKPEFWGTHHIFIDNSFKHAIFLLKKAKSLGLCPVGVSFHVGSQCLNVENYIQALDVSSVIFNEAKNVGLKLEVLDIGGGFPIRHFDNDDHITFKDLAKHLRKKMKRVFDKQTKFMAEPGRFFAGPSGTLIAQVIGRTFRNNKNYYYLNDGVYGDFSGIVFDHCRYEFKSLRRGQKFLSTLAGPTCDSFDTIALNVDLPEMDVGDVVYVKNIGAYSCASAVPSFNGFTPAKIIMV